MAIELHDDKQGSPFGESLTRRAVSSGAEQQLFRSYDVKGGRVELVDYMGSDGMVERVATAGHGRSIVNGQDHSQGEFLGYLAGKGIYQPFKFMQLKFNVQCPIEAALFFVYAQEASVNEYSGRYSTMLDSGERMEPEDLGLPIQHQHHAKEIVSIYNTVRNANVQRYKQLLSVDFARELARSGLGINNDTKFFWKIDLHSLASLYQRAARFFEGHDTLMPYLETIESIANAAAPAAWSALRQNPAKSLQSLHLAMPSDDLVVDAPLSPASFAPAMTKRITVESIENRLFVATPLLGQGGVQAVDYMGDDRSLAQAARVSYGQGTKKLQDDIQLIHALVRDEHTSPVEMAELALESKLPVFSDPRQAGRHRTLDMHGFMGRTPIGSQCYMPDLSQMMYQDRKDRQGRATLMTKEDNDIARRLLRESFDDATNSGSQLRALGASEQLVRKNKGVGFFTRGSRTGDALNWARFFKLRSDEHAQYEVRVYSQAVEEIFKAQLPVAYDAIRAYMLDAVKFSTREMSLLSTMDMDRVRAAVLADDRFSKDKKGSPGERELTREGAGFLKKLERMGKAASQ